MFAVTALLRTPTALFCLVVVCLCVCQSGRLTTQQLMQDLKVSKSPGPDGIHQRIQCLSVIQAILRIVKCQSDGKCVNIENSSIERDLVFMIDSGLR